MDRRWKFPLKKYVIRTLKEYHTITYAKDNNMYSILDDEENQIENDNACIPIISKNIILLETNNLLHSEVNNVKEKYDIKTITNASLQILLAKHLEQVNIDIKNGKKEYKVNINKVNNSKNKLHDEIKDQKNKIEILIKYSELQEVKVEQLMNRISAMQIDYDKEVKKKEDY